MKMVGEGGAFVGLAVTVGILEDRSLSFISSLGFQWG